MPRRTRDSSNSRCSKQPEARENMAFPTFLASVLIEFFGHNLPSRPPLVANEGASVGPEASNGVTESMGLMADLAPSAGPDPLIDPELAALAPSSWDLDTPANDDPGAPVVMVADVSRQLLCCCGGSSIEALSDTTERASAIEAVWRSVWRTSRVWDRSQLSLAFGSR